MTRMHKRLRSRSYLEFPELIVVTRFQSPATIKTKSSFENDPTVEHAASQNKFHIILLAIPNH